MIEIIRNQSEDAGWDHLIEQVLIQRIAEEGVEDVRAGKLGTNEDARSRMRSLH